MRNDPRTPGDTESAKIVKCFTYHQPKGDQIGRYESLRSEAKTLALFIHANCPESGEKVHALASLQQAVMWANASIAIHE